MDVLTLENIDYLQRIVIALILSSLIGLERNVHGRAAGVRTHVLVGVGAATFTIISIEMAMSTRLANPSLSMLPDPGRIAAQIITGIGFLGAGAIIKSGINIRGLTTAACLWMVASIGMAAGAKMYALASIAAVTSLMVLLVFNLLDFIIPNHSYRKLEICMNKDGDVDSIIQVIKGLKIRILSFNSEIDYVSDQMKLILNLRFLHLAHSEKYFSKIQTELQKSESKIFSLKWSK